MSVQRGKGKELGIGIAEDLVNVPSNLGCLEENILTPVDSRLK